MSFIALKNARLPLAALFICANMASSAFAGEIIASGAGQGTLQYHDPLASFADLPDPLSTFKLGEPVLVQGAYGSDYPATFLGVSASGLLRFHRYNPSAFLMETPISFGASQAGQVQPLNPIATIRDGNDDRIFTKGERVLFHGAYGVAYSATILELTDSGMVHLKINGEPLLAPSAPYYHLNAIEKLHPVSSVKDASGKNEYKPGDTVHFRGPYGENYKVKIVELTDSGLVRMQIPGNPVSCPSNQYYATNRLSP